MFGKLQKVALWSMDVWRRDIPFCISGVCERRVSYLLRFYDNDYLQGSEGDIIVVIKLSERKGGDRGYLGCLRRRSGWCASCGRARWRRRCHVCWRPKLPSKHCRDNPSTINTTTYIFSNYSLETQRIPNCADRKDTKLFAIYFPVIFTKCSLTKTLPP